MDIFQLSYMLLHKITGKPPNVWSAVVVGIAFGAILVSGMYAFMTWAFR